MKNFQLENLAFLTAEKSILKYFRNEALAELRKTFNITTVGNEVMILFRAERFNKTELFENCVFDNSVPVGCIIPYDAESIGNIKVMYFDSLKFDKVTGCLNAPITLKSFYDLGFNTWNDKVNDINAIINLFDEIAQFKNDFELVLSDGDNHFPGGQYLTQLVVPFGQARKYEASEFLIEHFFGVNNSHKSNFYTQKYKNEDAQQENEEYEAVQREMYG